MPSRMEDGTKFPNRTNANGFLHRVGLPFTHRPTHTRRASRPSARDRGQDLDGGAKRGHARGSCLSAHIARHCRCGRPVRSLRCGVGTCWASGRVSAAPARSTPWPALTGWLVVLQAERTAQPSEPGICIDVVRTLSYGQCHHREPPAIKRGHPHHDRHAQGALLG